MKRGIGVALSLISITALFSGCKEILDKTMKSDNAKLSSLTVSYGSLSPAFSSGVTEYSVNVPNTINTISVYGEPSDDKATVSKNNGVEQDLYDGANVITITVTAEDGTTERKYTVTVTRASAPANDDLAINTTDWTAFINGTPTTLKPASGVFEQTNEGIKIYGSGYRIGITIYHNVKKWKLAGQTVNLKFKVNGGPSSYMGLGFLLEDSVPEFSKQICFNKLSTGHSYESSVALRDDQFYYYTLTISDTGSYTTQICSDNYFAQGGTVVGTWNGTTALALSENYIVIGIWDNYSSTKATMTLAECSISKN